VCVCERERVSESSLWHPVAGWLRGGSQERERGRQAVVLWQITLANGLAHRQESRHEIRDFGRGIDPRARWKEEPREWGCCWGGWGGAEGFALQLSLLKGSKMGGMVDAVAAVKVSPQNLSDECINLCLSPGPSFS
jgi:hypothetical protein